MRAGASGMQQPGRDERWLCRQPCSSCGDGTEHGTASKPALEPSSAHTETLSPSLQRRKDAPLRSYIAFTRAQRSILPALWSLHSSSPCKASPGPVRPLLGESGCALADADPNSPQLGLAAPPHPIVLTPCPPAASHQVFLGFMEAKGAARLVISATSCCC